MEHLCPHNAKCLKLYIAVSRMSLPPGTRGYHVTIASPKFEHDYSEFYQGVFLIPY